MTTRILRSPMEAARSGPQLGTAASTVSTPRRWRRSATARTRSAASASATARPTTRLARWQALRDELDVSTAHQRRPPSADGTAGEAIAIAARRADRRDERRRASCAGGRPARLELGDHQAELAASSSRERTLERTWLLPRARRRPLFASGRAGDDRGHRDADRGGPGSRARAARPGDPRRAGPGPDRTRSSRSSTSSGSWPRSAPRPDRAASLRELLRRELGDVRTFISQLRPPLLDQLGPRRRHPRHRRPRAGGDRPRIDDRPDGPADASTTAERTVVLRVAQEALQNVRKHAAATNVTVSTARGRRVGPGGPRRWSRVRCRGGGRAWPPQLRPAIHARASRADRRPLRRTISTGRRHRRPAGDPTDGATGAEEST